MRIRDPQALARSIQELRRGRSYSTLAFDLAEETLGRLLLDPVQLYRLANGRHARTRALDSVNEAVIFAFGLMIIALRHGGDLPKVLDEGKTLLLNLLGPQAAELVFAEIRSRTPQNDDAPAMATFLRGLVSKWLPNWLPDD